MDAPLTQNDHSRGSSSAANEARAANTTVACIPCRKVKMKCTPSDKSSVCLRCQRKQFDCFYENHRRGRKLGTKIRVQASSTIQSGSCNCQKCHIAGSHSAEEGAPSVSEKCTMTAKHEVGSSVIPSMSETTEPAVAGKEKKVDGLSPFSLLNKNAMAGSFSVQNVLAAEPLGTSDAREKPPEEVLQINNQDPVTMGLLTLPTAMQLFDSFLKYMAPYIIHFDPDLHTYEYIRRRSSFLLATILAASAKIFNPDLHPKLHRQSEELLSKSFVFGDKSIETIKAVLMLTYWKEPEDTRVWTLVGYACRMCVELRGRRINPKNLGAGSPVLSPLKLREKRSLERTWLTLFVYDRSISLQLGKQWMLHVDELTRRVDTWCQHDLAMPSGDSILAAFVQLRIISSDLLDVLEIDFTSSNQQQHELLLDQFNVELDRWKEKWNVVFEKMSLEPAHLFLYRFYGLHARLYINSLQLQIMLVCTSSVAKQALWQSYTSALEMLQVIIEILGPAQLLYYAQDSIHVMTAYAAVFLIKIVLSMPEALPSTAELTITDTIARASEVFGTQCASPSTGCAYQARFLRNIVIQYWSSKRAKVAPETRQQNMNSIEMIIESPGSDQRARLNSNSSYHSASSHTNPPSDGVAGLHQTASSSFENNGLSVMLPFLGHVTSQDMRTPQPFWYQDVMNQDVWDGLLADPNLYNDDGVFGPLLN